MSKFPRCEPTREPLCPDTRHYSGSLVGALPLFYVRRSLALSLRNNLLTTMTMVV